MSGITCWLSFSLVSHAQHLVSTSSRIPGSPESRVAYVIALLTPVEAPAGILFLFQPHRMSGTHRDVFVLMLWLRHVDTACFAATLHEKMSGTEVKAHLSLASRINIHPRQGPKKAVLRYGITHKKEHNHHDEELIMLPYVRGLTSSRTS
jgi:hypothetical protein